MLRALPAAAALLASLAVLVLLGGPEAFRPSIPADSDLTGHLLPPELLRTELLPRGRIRGWSHDWFAGFPVNYFYFPLPSLGIALLGSVVDPATALRVVAWSAPVTLPVVLLLFARLAGLSPWARIGLVLGGSSFLLTVSFHAFGGNFMSSLAGEFAYGWALSFAILYLGVLGRASPGRADGVVAGLLLSAMILSHVLPPIAAVAGVAPYLLSSGRRRQILVSWAVAAGLTAFWTIPMLLRLDQVGDRGWAFAPGRADILPAEVLLLAPAAGVGLWLARRRVALCMLAVAAVTGVLVAAIPQSLVMRGRLIPVWILAIYVLAGVGLSQALSRGLRNWGWRVAAIILFLVPWGVVLVSRQPLELASVRDRVLEGIEAKPGATELARLVEALDRLPAGSVHWESDESLIRWGGPYVLSLLPLWTDHRVLKGLLGESAPITSLLGRLDPMLTKNFAPPLFPSDAVEEPWDPARGIGLLRMLGVRYFISVTEETAEAVAGVSSTTLRGTFGALTLFDLGVAPRVVVLNCGTVPPDQGESFRSHLPSWLLTASREQPWLADGLPRGSAGCSQGLVTEAVADIQVAPLRVSFRTHAVGVPHLVRVSYFPNWKARNAYGPHLAAPWFMVVVPQSEEVTLEFTATWAEAVGWLITAGTLLGLLALGVRSWRGWRTAGDGSSDPAR